MNNSKFIAKPFVKWAGGKYRLADKLIPLITKKFNPLENRYIEPMAGSGGFFFKYAPKNAYISDINQNLIVTYKTIRSDVHALITKLEEYKKLHVDEEYFYEQRKLFNKITKEDGNELIIASLFIYLNKTCFNGLYRENSNGEFNVPVGKSSKGKLLPMAFDKDNLVYLSKLLNPVNIACYDYKTAKNNIKKGDFVYIDPPYIPLDHISFTQYSKGDFGIKEHKELSTFCDIISDSGAFFMLSNSDTVDTRDIYLKEGRFSQKFNVSRSIASKAKNRTIAKELIITNYEI